MMEKVVSCSLDLDYNTMPSDNNELYTVYMSVNVRMHACMCMYVCVCIAAF